MSDIDRFLDAQNGSARGYAAALAEMQAGEKRTHWIWYIFPQIRGLGTSSLAQKFALRDLSEAGEYAAHPILGNRLREIAETALLHLEAGKLLPDLMGSEIDALKLVSSMTLFAAVPGNDGLRTICKRLLDQAGAQGYPRCSHTLRILNA